MVTAPENPAAEQAPRAVALTGLWLGPLLFLGLLWLPAPEGLSPAGWRVAAVAAFMAVWWLTQAVPLPATGMLPAVLFPLLQVTTLGAATQPYAHPLVFLFLGGFVIALTIERWNLHRRIAIGVIAVAGTRPHRLVGGFMAATAGLSMWVSNTATTLMMVPIALSVVGLIEQGRGGAWRGPDADLNRFARGLLLAVAYSASIGGLATLIGTPPNAFLAGYLAQTHGIQIGFAAWMVLGLPVTLVLLVAAWFILTRLLYRADNLDLRLVRTGIARERAQLGPPERGEVLAALLFAAVALAWVFRPLLEKLVPLSDTGIALIGTVLAFAVPVNLKERTFLMDWDAAQRLPWGILLLFGGGLSLAGAIEATGLATWLGGLVAGAGHLPVAVLLLAITALVVFLTELTSNTATAAVFVPVAATLAMSLGYPPAVFAVPVALAASCAFMMPVATPPNAIVFSAGRLDVAHMAQAGLLLNIVATLVITGAAVWLVPRLFGAG